ncbi:O-methyltransferase [Halococcoides cellulosivorans]|uniref:Methyltransferase n=1 Tax=Halococcoides cellulosivorans TaxID=1679096 RepID=A0A2R4WZP1_9EURY|nr:O-methyltransferase [Halococcoides cellulosivorans]AWB27018.1 methyltransferase [Halococcoides cellulosivorans]
MSADGFAVTDAISARIGPRADRIVAAMDRRAARDGFPTIGPAAGGWLATLARLIDAERAVEFGSGFGYSAYWLLRGAPDCAITLTEIDADELDLAREYLAAGGVADRATFEHGDAHAILADGSAPLDFVLVDCEKTRYAEAFETVRDRIASGGIVVADNAVAGAGIDRAAVRAALAGETDPDHDATGGIVSYLETVRADPDFQSGLLPVGEGLAVSVRTGGTVTGDP